jgi:quercetin dioxygenase-like cupin family protein
MTDSDPRRAPRSLDEMVMPADALPLPIQPPPDPIDRDVEPLLSAGLASAWGAGESVASASSSAVRARLLERSAASRAASGAMFTVRLNRLAATALTPTARARTLYAAPPKRALRPGEPVRARLVELHPGGHWDGPDRGRHREWLVLRGSARLGDQPLQVRDYHAVPAGLPSFPVTSEEGALLFLRESDLAALAGDGPLTVRDAEAGWPEFAPGIRRRVLWHRDGEAAMLYLARPGAAVPHHRHGHDEECLMVQGELFLDDLLLQPGDYQLAPAGTSHQITATDTGVVIFAHGDLDLRFVG